MALRSTNCVNYVFENGIFSKLSEYLTGKKYLCIKELGKIISHFFLSVYFAQCKSAGRACKAGQTDLNSVLVELHHSHTFSSYLNNNASHLFCYCSSTPKYHLTLFVICLFPTTFFFSSLCAGACQGASICAIRQRSLLCPSAGFSPSLRTW